MDIQNNMTKYILTFMSPLPPSPTHTHTQIGAMTKYAEHAP